MQRNRRNVLRIVGIITLAILFITVVGFVIWASTPLGPMPEAVESLSSDDFVQVSSSPWYTFDPKTMQATTGFIIYPGGRVDPVPGGDRRSHHQHRRKRAFHRIR